MDSLQISFIAPHHPDESAPFRYIAYQPNPCDIASTFVGIDDAIDLDHFFELTHDLLIVAGNDGYFRKVNPAVCQLLGYSVDELRSRPISEFIHPDDRELTAKHREHLIQGTPLLNFENRYITKSGDVVWLAWTSIPVGDAGLIYAIAKNITHKKKLEHTRNELLTSFTRINSDLKQLTYTTAHDLRSPVANLLAVFQLIDMSKIHDPETIGFIQILKTATDSLKKTLDAYVDVLSTKDSLHVTVEECDLEACLIKVLESLGTLTQSANLDIQYDFAAAPTIRFNTSYLESVFLNLTTNSIKYKKPGMRPSVRVTSRSDNGYINVMFSDNGLGFDLDGMRDKLFGFRETFHGHEDSKGIGLYLIHSHITSLGGRIDIDSNPNEGATFILTFKK